MAAEWMGGEWMGGETWVQACRTDDVEPEDVVRFDHAGRTFAIYRGADDSWHATDGLCTHEQVHLADGLVMGHLIECPKHNGRFDIRTGAAKGGAGLHRPAHPSGPGRG